MITPNTLQPALLTLDEALRVLGEKRELIVCGGAALIALDIVSRQTRDVDVVDPELDDLLKAVVRETAGTLGLQENWLNDGPKILVKELPSGWRSRCEPLFQGQVLILKVLGRIDLLATKLFAFCDREDDKEDVLALKPSIEELESLFPWVLERDASAYWPGRVESCFKRIKKALYGTE